MKIKYSFEQWCLDNNHQDYLDLWDYKLNSKVPGEIGSASNAKYYFKCPRNIHQSELKTIFVITQSPNYDFCKRCNSMGQWIVDNLGEDALNTYWGDQNMADPYNISHGADSVKVWIKCQTGAHPEYDITPYNFIRGNRCPVCSSKVVVEDINSIFVTHPQYIKYFSRIEDAKMHTINSHKRVEFKCPMCGTVRTMPIRDAIRNNFPCMACGDGFSFPNKFVHNVLLQIANNQNISFVGEKIFDWSKNLNDKKTFRRYDFYISSPRQMIIEVHGAQHYISDFSSLDATKTLEAEQKNDIYKYELALDNGFSSDNYIVIDARRSEPKFIQQSILNSKLSEYFDLSFIDWRQCFEFAANSLVIECAQLFKQGFTKRQIVTALHMSSSTIDRYLKKCRQIGYI
jgi:hypothetical protein